MPSIGTCFRFYTQMRVEKQTKLLPIKLKTVYTTVYYLYHCIYKPQPDFWNSFVPALHWFLYYMPILCIKVYSSFVKGMKKFCIDFDSFVIAMQVFHSQRHRIFLKIVLVFGNVPKKESLKVWQFLKYW